jgi:hypothetical protein
MAYDVMEQQEEEEVVLAEQPNQVADVDKSAPEK